MPYDPSHPGIGEAALLAVQARLQTGISALATSLARPPAFPPPASGDVIIGHPHFLAQGKAHLICVTTPDDDAAVEQEMEFIDGGFPAQTLMIDIVHYIHPDYMRADDRYAVQQMERIVMARIADWMRILFTGPNTTLILGSKERHPDGDRMQGWIDSIQTYIAQTGAAGSLYAPTVWATYIGRVV